MLYAHGMFFSHCVAIPQIFWMRACYVTQASITLARTRLEKETQSTVCTAQQHQIYHYFARDMLRCIHAHRVPQDINTI